jgi:hypothetical protein
LHHRTLLGTFALVVAVAAMTVAVVVVVATAVAVAVEPAVRGAEWQRRWWR